MSNNYFYIDGYNLIAQIRNLQKENASYRKRKLDSLKFVNYIFF